MSTLGTATTPALPPSHVAEEGVRLEFLPLVPLPGLKLIHEYPPVFSMDDFLSAEECEALKAMAMPSLFPSIVVDAVEGRTVFSSRTSSSCFLEKSSTEWLSAKVTALTGKPHSHFEPAQVTNYKFGQLYAPHFDAFDVTNAPGLECAALGGQRVATVLIYLNDCESGGGTYFPRLGLRMMPKRGKVVVFFPCSLTGQLDPLALHTGEPAVEEKWLCQIWVRQTEFGLRVL